MPDEPGALTPRGEKIARVQQMCTEGFCNISTSDKDAIREVLHSMYDAVADHRQEMERLNESLKIAITEKRKEQEENNNLRQQVTRQRSPQKAEEGRMTREEFLAERRTGIGGSDCDSLFDLLPYGCRRRLWNTKRGVETDFEVDVTSQMERGTMLEPLVAELYQRKTDRAVVTIGVVRDIEHPELLVHCDRVISKQPYDSAKWRLEHESLADLSDEELQLYCYNWDLYGPWGVLVIKTGNREMFHRYKAEGLPAAHVLQVQHAMSVTGLSWGAFALFWPDGWKMLLFDYDRNEGLIQTVKMTALDFWHLVQNGPAPAPLPPSDERCDGCQYRHSCHGKSAGPVCERNGDD